MTTQAFAWTGSISQAADATTAYSLGIRFELLVGNSFPCIGVRYRLPITPSTPNGILTAGLYKVSNSSLVASGTYTPTGGDADTDVDILFSVPFTLLDGASEEYVAAVQTGNNAGGNTVRYAFIPAYSVPVTQSPLFAGSDPFAFASSNTLVLPTTSSTANFLVSPILNLSSSQNGVLAAALGGVHGAITGTRTVLGTVSAPLGGLTASASGIRTVFGVLAAPLGALSAAALVSRVTGAGAPIVSSSSSEVIVSTARGARL